MNMTNKALAEEVKKISNFFFTSKRTPESIYDPYEILCEVERRLETNGHSEEDILKEELDKLGQLAKEAKSIQEHREICVSMCELARMIQMIQKIRGERKSCGTTNPFVGSCSSPPSL